MTKNFLDRMTPEEASLCIQDMAITIALKFVAQSKKLSSDETFSMLAALAHDRIRQMPLDEETELLAQVRTRYNLQRVTESADQPTTARKEGAKTLKTPEEIVEQANRLARELYYFSGYVVRDGYRFDKAIYPQERAMWWMARAAFVELTDTDPKDALIEIDEI